MRWDLIEAGTIAKTRMVTALRAIPGASIGWVQTGDLVLGRADAAMMGIARATTRIEDILADPAVDAA